MVILMGIQLSLTHLQVFMDEVLEAALCCAIHFVALYPVPYTVEPFKNLMCKCH